MATTTIGRGKSKGMATGRNAAAKAKANGDRIAEMNGQLTRDACVLYLQAHGVYGGHSRDSVQELRRVVAAYQADYAEREAEASARLHDTELVVLHPSGPDRVAAAKAEHKALQAWTKDGENPPRPATPNLDALNAEHAAGVTAADRHRATRTNGATTTRQPVPADHPLLRYVPDAQQGTPVPAELGLVHTVDGNGLVRCHKATCKPAATDRVPLATWPAQVYAAACCKPRTPGAEARTKYVPPSKRTA